MTENITELIAEARTWPRDGVNEGALVNALADALEQQAAEIARIAENRNEWASRMMELASITEQRDRLAAQIERADDLRGMSDGAIQALVGDLKAALEAAEKQLAAAQAALADEREWWETMREDHGEHIMILREASLRRLTADPAPFLDEVRAQALEYFARTVEPGEFVDPEMVTTVYDPYDVAELARFYAAALRTPAPTETKEGDRG